MLSSSAPKIRDPFFGYTTVDRRASHKRIGTGLCCHADGIGRHPTIHLQPNINTQLRFCLCEASKLGHHVRHKDLPTETWFNRHDENLVKLREKVKVRVELGAGLQRDSR